MRCLHDTYGLFLKASDGYVCVCLSFFYIYAIGHKNTTFLCQNLIQYFCRQRMVVLTLLNPFAFSLPSDLLNRNPD